VNILTELSITTKLHCLFLRWEKTVTRRRTKMTIMKKLILGTESKTPYEARKYLRIIYLCCSMYCAAWICLDVPVIVIIRSVDPGSASSI
jgi:hypothetical protein